MGITVFVGKIHFWNRKGALFLINVSKAPRLSVSFHTALGHIHGDCGLHLQGDKAMSRPSGRLLGAEMYLLQIRTVIEWELADAC